MSKKHDKSAPAEPVTVYDADLASFGQDQRNANKGTERGQGMLAKSISELGAARSIVVDKHGRIPAGNKTQQALVTAGMTNAIVVETDGSRPVVVKRMDWDLDDVKGAARRYAYLDNRVAQVDLEWDPEVIKADITDGVDFAGLFSDGELQTLILERVEGATDPEEEWKGMPEFTQDDKTSVKSVIVHFKTNRDAELFSELIGQKLSEKTRSIWYPTAEIETYADKCYEDDSDAPGE